MERAAVGGAFGRAPGGTQTDIHGHTHAHTGRGGARAAAALPPPSVNGVSPKGRREERLGTLDASFLYLERPSRERYTQFVLAYAAPLKRLVRRLVSSDDLAEDVVQETILRTRKKEIQT
jgi:hypothetical protein